MLHCGRAPRASVSIVSDGDLSTHFAATFAHRVEHMTAVDVVAAGGNPAEHSDIVCYAMLGCFQGLI